MLEAPAGLLDEDDPEELVDQREREIDRARKQADNAMRLTMVSSCGMVGTIVTGFPGMNLQGREGQRNGLAGMLGTAHAAVVQGGAAVELGQALAQGGLQGAALFFVQRVAHRGLQVFLFRLDLGPVVRPWS